MTTTIQYFEGSVTVGNPALLQTVDVIFSYQNGVKLAHVCEIESFKIFFRVIYCDCSKNVHCFSVHAKSMQALIIIIASF